MTAPIDYVRLALHFSGQSQNFEVPKPFIDRLRMGDLLCPTSKFSVDVNTVFSVDSMRQTTDGSYQFNLSLIQFDRHFPFLSSQQNNQADVCHVVFDDFSSIQHFFPAIPSSGYEIMIQDKIYKIQQVLWNINNIDYPILFVSKLTAAENTPMLAVGVCPFLSEEIKLNEPGIFSTEIEAGIGQAKKHLTEFRYAPFNATKSSFHLLPLHKKSRSIFLGLLTSAKYAGEAIPIPGVAVALDLALSYCLDKTQQKFRAADQKTINDPTAQGLSKMQAATHFNLQYDALLLIQYYWVAMEKYSKILAMLGEHRIEKTSNGLDQMSDELFHKTFLPVYYQWCAALRLAEEKAEFILQFARLMQNDLKLMNDTDLTNIHNQVNNRLHTNAISL